MVKSKLLKDDSIYTNLPFSRCLCSNALQERDALGETPLFLVKHQIYLLEGRKSLNSNYLSSYLRRKISHFENRSYRLCMESFGGSTRMTLVRDCLKEPVTWNSLNPAHCTAKSCESLCKHPGRLPTSCLNAPAKTLAQKRKQS